MTNLDKQPFIAESLQLARFPDSDLQPSHTCHEFEKCAMETNVIPHNEGGTAPGQGETPPGHACLRPKEPTKVAMVAKGHQGTVHRNFSEGNVECCGSAGDTEHGRPSGAMVIPHICDWDWDWEMQSTDGCQTNQTVSISTTPSDTSAQTPESLFLDFVDFNGVEHSEELSCFFMDESAA